MRESNTATGRRADCREFREMALSNTEELANLHRLACRQSAEVHPIKLLRGQDSGGAPFELLQESLKAKAPVPSAWRFCSGIMVNCPPQRLFMLRDRRHLLEFSDKKAED